jgi:hypothetical protein
MEKLKNLHVMVPEKEHLAFLVKYKEDGKTGSEVVRQWIRDFLKGEKN